MRLVVFCLLLAGSSGAQAILEDSAVGRLHSILRQIEAEAVFQPISLIIVVQTNNTALTTLAKIPIGPMLEPLVTGKHGEIAVLSFGDQVRTAQSFTSDSATAARAIARLKVNRASSHMVDAVMVAIADLDIRPPNRRRIILVIGEGKDRGSEIKLRDAISRAQRSNVLIYSLF